MFARILIVALALAGSTAMARPDSLKMSCETAHNLVMSEGAVVIGTGPYVYDRFVAHQGFCTVSEQTEPAWIPTADAQYCWVGYTCTPKEGGDN